MGIYFEAGRNIQNILIEFLLLSLQAETGYKRGLLQFENNPVMKRGVGAEKTTKGVYHWEATPYTGKYILETNPNMGRYFEEIKPHTGRYIGATKPHTGIYIWETNLYTNKNILKTSRL
ncbi:MAG: hypothetical protein IKG88_00355 [Bacteroidales bacterium]|nr:hypothetical protein [Bacteroidales bacterium]